MLFNSIDFAFFLPIVFLIYWFLVDKNIWIQNLFIVIVSFIFYGWWDWRFLILIFISILVDYWVGIGLMNQENQKKRKLFLWISIGVNLGLLIFFKYFNFFIETFEAGFSFFGKEISHNSLNIILPVGISFYTFQTMSYSIDVYKRKFLPTTDFIAFSAFVSFFPQLVAGPIERAADLLPQFYKKRTFDYSKAVDGSRQILWGLFQKIMIADSCAPFVNEVFSNPSNYTGFSLIIGASLFIIQIYCDFSGYSNIGIGVARLFGFHLKQNFAFPLFSKSIRELWTRWHISLANWFRDYIFIPLGGSKVSRRRTMINLIAVFLVVGLWHGSNWTFVVFGLLNGIYLIFPLLFKTKIKLKIRKNSLLFGLKNIGFMTGTFLLFAFSGIFFRATNLINAIQYVKAIFNNPFNNFNNNVSNTLTLPIYFILIILFFFLIEWNGKKNKHAIEYFLLEHKTHTRYLFYFTLIILMFVFGGEKQQFIYFQF